MEGRRSLTRRDDADDASSLLAETDAEEGAGGTRGARVNWEAVNWALEESAGTKTRKKRKRRKIPAKVHREQRRVKKSVKQGVDEREQTRITHK